MHDHKRKHILAAIRLQALPSFDDPIMFNCNASSSFFSVRLDNAYVHDMMRHLRFFHQGLFSTTRLQTSVASLFRSLRVQAEMADIQMIGFNHDPVYRIPRGPLSHRLRINRLDTYAPSESSAYLNRLGVHAYMCVYLRVFHGEVTLSFCAVCLRFKTRTSYGIQLG